MISKVIFFGITATLLMTQSAFARCPSDKVVKSNAFTNIAIMEALNKVDINILDVAAIEPIEAPQVSESSRNDNCRVSTFVKAKMVVTMKDRQLPDRCLHFVRTEFHLPELRLSSLSYQTQVKDLELSSCR